jgi:AraC-like DNA-binding protein
MITEFLENKKTEPRVLVENKISFNGPQSQLSIYDTFEQANNVQLKSDQPLFCAMISGKKVMHSSDDNYHSDFLPHESFVMAPNQIVEIDFPIAQLTKPTRCLAIEISTDRIQQVADQLNHHQKRNKEFGDWHYLPQIVHTHHNSQTQALLQRMTHIFTENHQDRSYMIDLAVNELTTRLLRQQSRELMMSFCLQQADHSAMTAVIYAIEKNLAENVNIDNLCKLACMSRTKFFSEFKQHLGCTPLAFQQQRRLKKAHDLISTGKQITQVCFELGFISSSHFSRLFKQFYGISPKAFQKEHF